MKNLLLILLFPLFLFGQKESKYKLHTPHTKLFTKNDLIVYALQYAAGCAEGEHDRIQYHPNQFFKDHPNMNMQWWDPRISWKNKYNRSWFTRTFAIWTTDENHASKAVEHTLTSISLAISFNDFKNWKAIVKRAAVSYVINRAGFHSFYR